MVIASDVTLVAAHWGLDPRQVQAVVYAEGDGEAFVRAVQCSLPATTNRAQALEVLCRSLTHRYRAFVAAGLAGGDAAFAAYFASYWAPHGVANDPHNLNAHWLKNFSLLWLGEDVSRAA